MRRAILGREGGHQLALHDDVELCTTVVYVRCVESARTQEPKRHGAAGADQGREGLAVCTHRLAPLAFCDAGIWWVGSGVEVEDHLRRREEG